MKLVHGTMLPPNLCVICEQSHQDKPHVDTFREIDPDHFTNLSGRKYVCIDCLDQMAKLAGYEHSTTVAEAEQFLALQRDNALSLRHKLERMAAASLAWFHELPDSAVDHAPPTKAEVPETDDEV